ncbi:integrase [Streptomyces sp. T1317-0309]|nr:integrase [Streptomyces sp. T1317-0309]
MPATLAFSAKAQGPGYVCPLYRLFFTFLWQRGLNWDGRRRTTSRTGGLAPTRGDESGAVDGGTWAKEQAALKLLYGIAAQRGLVPSNPVTLASPSDVKSSDVKWLSPRAFRLWRNVGLGGMLPGGLEDEAWRGRSAGDTAYADLMYSSGLRRREGGTLLLCELPALGRRNYCGPGGPSRGQASRLHLLPRPPGAPARRGLPDEHARLGGGPRRRRGVYDRLPDLRIIQRVSRAGRVQWRSQDGRVGESALGRLTAAERMRLFVEGEDGLEPAMLWLTEAGLPCGTRAGRRSSSGGAVRGRGADVFATPKMLRHSMALRTLIALHNALDRRLGLTPAERLHYEEVYGQVWLMVKDMLGHRSEQVTRDVYLEPVRGLQLESLLGDDDNPVNAEKIAELAARTGLILDTV